MNLIKYLFSKKHRNKLSASDTLCSCGKHDKCTRELIATNKGYFGIDTLYVRKQDYFRCGKVQKQINKMIDSKLFLKLKN